MEIYTDGGYSIPKGVGGWAMIVVNNKEVIYTENGTQKDSTSNRMEMTAFIKALEYTNQEITIFTDSNYVVQGFNNWSKQWKKKDWKKADGKPIKNKDLWMRIDELRRDNIEVKWIKGHNGHEYNELVDSLTRDYS